jgi:hypothetical protein
MDDRRSVQCETCGYAVPAVGLIQIPFDDDRENVAEMLAAGPLVAPCPNCGSAVASISAIAFVDAENRVAACLAVDEHGEALADELRRSDTGWTFSVHGRPEELARSVRSHLDSLAAQAAAIISDLAKAVQKESARKIQKFVFAPSARTPSRRMLNAIGMLGGAGKASAETVAPIIATRHSFHCLVARTDTVAALDASVPAWLVNEREIARLVGFGMALGAGASIGSFPGMPPPNRNVPMEAGVAAVLAAAWASDRTGTTFAHPGAPIWATCVVDWLLRYPGAAATLGPDDFLRRTVDNVQVANVGVAKLVEDRTRTGLIDELERRGLFGGIDFAAHLKQVLGIDAGVQ